MRTREKFNNLRNEYAKFAVLAEVLQEIKKIESIDDLKAYIQLKEREFWDKSTPIATDICETLTKLGEEYIEGEKVKDD